MPAKTRTRKPSNANTQTASGAMIAENVGRALADRPQGATAQELGKATGLATSDVTRALGVLQSANAAIRVPGRSTENPKTADVWKPAGAKETHDTVDSTNAATDDESAAGREDALPADPPPEAPTSGADARPVEPDHRVLGVASILASHTPDGLTAAEVAELSGLRGPITGRVLAAMEISNAARRLSPDEDGVERWVRGDGDPAAVDVSQAPTHRECPTCGHKTRITVAVGRSRGSGQPGVNGDGQQALRKGELRALVLEFINELSGQILTAGTIAKELGRSPGAVRNNLDYLLAQGLIQHADDGDGKEVTALATKPEDM